MAMAKQCEQIPVDVPGRSGRPVMTCVVRAPGPAGSDTVAPFVLLHGFDTSCLEYRQGLTLVHVGAQHEHLRDTSIA